ncbi:hypothetical protein RKE30_01845 [Streptomyces sp. Li-HN-5-11]|uniref:hypothetical protein n=1 Tax=Streptomyces sp. Li-HN-5-11 TaxID=3075432 RepID=UPI0028B06A51|nr:hypothetical protein [Streptomyces sp. Li-HN-5-11]WNM29236.1 hypothetical protein RKE30_01845 [Streptomyces sp. Li-HN-5-11]
MPEADIRPRPDIVALLCGADLKRRPDTNTYSHRDGRPFSKEEQALAFTATRVELEEVSAQLARYREYRRAMEEAPEAFRRFLAPFMEQLTEKNLGNAVQLMSVDERTEFDRLLGLLIDPVRPFTPYDF